MQIVNLERIHCGIMNKQSYANVLEVLCSGNASGIMWVIPKGAIMTKGYILAVKFV